MKISPVLVLPLCLLAYSSCAPAATPPSGPLSSLSPSFLPASEFSSSIDLTAAVPASADATLPDAPQAQTSPDTQTKDTPVGPAVPPGPASLHQTKRILFIIPNFRSVSADEKLPPTTTPQKFKLLLQDTFDYSAFAETAVLAGMGEIQNSEPEFHSGFPGYARYYWHSFADLADGNLMTEFLYPVTTREDPRYYTLGHGSFLKRSVYSVTRLAITRNNQGHNTVNVSEVLGNGSASAISSLYYPSPERTWTKVGQRWVLQVGIDGLSNLLKEFWPDINRNVLHSKY